MTLGQVTSDDLRVIKSGLGPDDRLIVDGLMRARPGQQVTPQSKGRKARRAGQTGRPIVRSK